MGWTLGTAWSSGIRSEVQTFSGAGLPTAFGGSNTTSTGIVRTDIDANAVTVTDQAGKLRRSITNALGQLVRVDEPNDQNQLGTVASPNQATNYSYDTLNNLTSVNQGAQTRTFTYNSLSRLTSATNPESGTMNYVYDNNGNLTQKDDARGVRASYVYDALNRVTNRNYSLTGSTPPNYQATPNVSYFYDGANISGGIANSKGKLTKVSSSVSTTEYTAFDILGRVTAHKQTTDGNAYTTGYNYNLSSALIEETYPSGRVVKNTLDIDGDLQQVQSRKANDTFRNYANAFTYTAAGAVSSLRLGNGKFENTQFNSRLQPTQIGLGSSATNQNLLKLNYDYGTTDNNGNVKSQTITVPTVGINTGFTAIQTYTYDSLNRIKDAKEMIGTTQTWKQTFTYDRYGNRRFDVANTTTIPTGCAEAVCNPQIDANTNKLVGYQFDNAGNTKVDANGQTFTYDSENKQVAVTNSNGTVGEYSYDGDGKRVKKVVPNGETTIFVYDANSNLVAEYSTIVEPQATAKISYLTNDHLGSPRITTDALGQIVSRRDFKPFGEEISRTNYGSDSVRQKFTGYERDNETNLDFAKARMYSSSLGRFSAADPLFESQKVLQPQSQNRYSYVLNNPLKFVDPSGLVWGYVDLIEGERRIREFRWFEGDTPDEGYTVYTDPYYDSGDGRLYLNPNGPAGWITEGAGLGESGGLFTINIDPYVRNGYTMGPTPEQYKAYMRSGAVEDVSWDFVGLFIPGRIGAKALAGAVGTKAAIEAVEGSVTTLYRAVSHAEFEQIMKTGTFQAGKNSASFGKYFAESAEDAAKWGEKLEGKGNYRIVDAQIPTLKANEMMRWEKLDNIGPARYATFDELKGAKIRPVK